MRPTLDIVDAFAEGPFTGNPAAVCVLEEERPASWMQALASEMNLSETAFVRPVAEGLLALRWFTPSLEVDLCGHATLASAHVLLERGLARTGQSIAFDTKSGRLTASSFGAEDRSIELDFPEETASEEPAPRELRDAVGVSPLFTGRNRFDWLFELASEEEVRAAAPDFRRLAAATRPDRGVIVTARGSRPEVDFVSRFFAPAAGIDEDPVTGSAHCALAPFWSQRLGRTELTARQLSPRGGALVVRVADGHRVKLRGRAVTVTRGELAT